MELNQEQQEKVLKIQKFEQQMNAIQQQIQAVESAKAEMGILLDGLEEIKGKKDSEVLAPVGRGIFAKTKLISEELLVDIGEKNLVKKSIDETKKLIQEQIEKLAEAGKELEQNSESLTQEIAKFFKEIQDKEK